MSFKDIMVYVGNGASGQQRAGFAIDFAARHEAFLTITAFSPTSLFPIYGEPGIAPPLPASWFEEQASGAQKRLDKIADRAEKQGVRVETRLLGGAVGDQSALLVEQAIYADLTIVGQPEGGAIWSSRGEVISNLLVRSGRPVLVVPREDAGAAQFDTILAAFDGSPEASRALHDALPLLQAAQRVILYVDKRAGRSQIDADDPGVDISRHLARHGVKIELVQDDIAEQGTGDLLLARVKDEGVGLIVMGGFHHSRLREMLIGGATRQVLENMKVPVFLSH